MGCGGKHARVQDKVTITIGIPYLSGPDSIDFTTVQQFTAAASTKTEKITSSIPVTLDQLVPGMTAQAVTAKVPAGAITVQVSKRQLGRGPQLDASYALHVHPCQVHAQVPELLAADIRPCRCQLQLRRRTHATR